MAGPIGACINSAVFCIYPEKIKTRDVWLSPSQTSTVTERRETREKGKKKKSEVRNNTNGDFLVRNTRESPAPKYTAVFTSPDPLVLFPPIALSIPFPLLDFYFLPVLLLSFTSPYRPLVSAVPPCFCLFFPPPPFSFTGINCIPLFSFYSLLLSSFLFPPFPALFHSASSHESFARLGARVFTNRALFLDGTHHRTQPCVFFSSRSTSFSASRSFVPRSVPYLFSLEPPRSFRFHVRFVLPLFSSRFIFLSLIYSAPFSSCETSPRASPLVSRGLSLAVHDSATRAISPPPNPFHLCFLYQNNTYAYGCARARAPPDNREYQSEIL